ncbi:MAG TPA: precorrin-6A synthase (deacetylating) [Parvibaculum sp.]|jgi:precorrin-6A synthase
MRRILIIGIGAGNPEHMTVQAIKALNRADVFFIPNKGSEKAALQKLRMDICERFIESGTHRFVDVPVPERAKEFTDYRANVDDWHARIGEGYEKLLTEELGEDQCGAFLVWGDPALYDSTLRIIERLRERIVFDYEVIPGISSVQALAATHRIPLNRIGEPVLITTGRKLASGFPEDAGSVVVMLDGEQSFKRFGDEGLDIYWGAYLGSEEEILVAGKLADVMDEIEVARADARDRNGWIMDTYLLRKSE